MDVNIDLEFGNLLSELATLGCILATPRPFLATLDDKFGNPGPILATLDGKVANRQELQ
jgi:hypothetical protein